MAGFVKNIPQDMRDKYSQVEWRKIAGLRDILDHTYFQVEDQIIWDVDDIIKPKS
ncbi:MAG: DUF86 domain-containing protein [Rivularia sp. T60_A2020_040]|nr:DUF86 domain-containing protein [Rivularia sp. T60_A2020_040]